MLALAARGVRKAVFQEGRDPSWVVDGARRYFRSGGEPRGRRGTRRAFP
jgi:hypothetical protein